MANLIFAAALKAGSRLWRGVTTLPDADGWRFSAVAGFAALGAMGIVALLAGLFRPAEPDLAALPARAINVFFVPALGEEAFFRGLLVRDRTETSRPWPDITLATVAFTAWHAVETLFLRHAAPIFLRVDFLTCAAILGAACATLRWRTSSLWPAVALHWLVVIVWQTWLGGPGLGALR